MNFNLDLWVSLGQVGNQLYAATLVFSAPILTSRKTSARVKLEPTDRSRVGSAERLASIDLQVQGLDSTRDLGAKPVSFRFQGAKKQININLFLDCTRKSPSGAGEDKQ